MHTQVILFGGQSNMDFNINRSFFHEDVLAHANDPLLRVATVETTVARSPREDIMLNAWPTRQWQPVTPSSAVNVSAVAYFAGRQLRRQLGEAVPIGLLCSYLSGSPIEPWLPAAAVEQLHLDCGQMQDGYCSSLWNGMIYPLRQHSIAAHVWWQGEGNVANMTIYSVRFTALISSWRSEWAASPERSGVLPFFFFLLEPYSLAWYNILREQQLETARALPSVYGVNVLDIGDRSSPYGTVHTRNKEVAGYRLSLQMLREVYKFNNIAMGPVMTGASIVSATNGSQTVSVTFDDQAWPMPMRVLPTEQCKSCCSSTENPFSAGATPVASRMKAATHAFVDSDADKASVLHVSFDLSDPKDLLYIGLHFTAYPECTLHGGSGLPAQPAIMTIKTDDASSLVPAKPNITHVTPSRFPTDPPESAEGKSGGTPLVVYGNNFLPNATGALCRIDPIDGASLHVLRAGNPNAYKGDNCFNYVVFPAMVVSNQELHCSAPSVSADGPGILSVSMDNGTTWMDWQIGLRVMYFTQFQVAVGRRPYITESTGHLLVQIDRSLHNKWIEISAVFAGNHLARWVLPAANASAALPFALNSLPNEVNNDMKISFRVGSASAPPTVAFRRLMRAPVPPPGVEAVQVDHWTRSLLVNGSKQFDGNGWYMGSFGNGYQPEALNQLRRALPALVQQGINMGMVGNLNSLYFNDSAGGYQEQFLNAAAKAGFKVIYPVVQGANFSIPGGGPYNHPALLQTIKLNVQRVRSHPAILGYYVCAPDKFNLCDPCAACGTHACAGLIGDMHGTDL